MLVRCRNVIPLLCDPSQESTADGRTVTTTAELTGNKLVKRQAHPTLTSIETREFLENGNRMMLIHTMPSKPGVKSVRGYVRCQNNAC